MDACNAQRTGAGFPGMCETAQARAGASETAIKATNGAQRIHGAAGYSRNLPPERMARDARMSTIGGGMAQILRTQVAGSILGVRTPQTRDGYAGAGLTAGEPGSVAVGMPEKVPGGRTEAGTTGNRRRCDHGT